MVDVHVPSHAESIWTTPIVVVDPAALAGAADVFDEPSLWRAWIARAVGLRGLELCQALGAGPAFPSALTSALAAMPDLRDALVIDVGAGTGATSEHIRWSTGAHVIAIEPSPGAIHACRQLFPNIMVAAGSAAQLPFAPRVARGVIFNGVLSLVSEIGPVLEEAHRVLTDDGVVAITDLFLDVGDELRAAPNVFRSVLGLVRALDEAGFEPIEIGLGSTDARIDWCGPRQALDELAEELFSREAAFAAFRHDQLHLAALTDRGVLIGGCIAARPKAAKTRGGLG